MGWITLVLYIGVLLIWVYFGWRALLVRPPRHPADRRTFAILTVIAAALTALQLMS